MKEEIDNLVREALILIKERTLSEIIFCPYHGRERGEYFDITEREIESRIKYSVCEGFNVELIPSPTQLILCVWEYPGPKPESEYVVNFLDIPGFVKDLEGE